MSFEEGQRVVFISNTVPNFAMSTPKKDEIVTIGGADFDLDCEPDYYWLKEYRFCKDGYPQFFKSYHLRPLDWQKETVEEICENILEEELILT